MIHLFLILLIAVAAATPVAVCPDPERDATTFPPSINVAASGFGPKDYLKVAVDVPILNTRSESTFELTSCPSIIPSLIIPDPTNCNTQYILNQTWSDWKNCGAVEHSRDANEVIYKGLIYVSFTEKAGDIFGTEIIRKVVNTLEYRVIFPLNITAETRDFTDIYAPVHGDALLENFTLKIDYDISCPDKLNLTAVTGVQDSFVLKFDNFEIPWDGVSQKLVNPDWESIEVRHETSGDGVHLLQWWAMSAEPLVQCLCQLDRVMVNLTFHVECKPGLINCPITNPLDEIYEVSFYLTSSDWCGKVVAEVSISATMATYTDAFYNVSTNAYFLGRNAFVKAAITSPEATIAQSTVAKVDVWGTAVQGHPSSASPLDITALCTISTAVPEHPVWFFMIDPTIFQAADDSFSQLKIKAYFDVIFLGNVKRDMEKHSQKLVLESTLDITRHSTPDTDAAGQLTPLSWLF